MDELGSQARHAAALAPPAPRPPLDLPAQETGQAPLDLSVRAVILRLSGENPHSGYRRIARELKGAGIAVSATSVRKVLLEQGLQPAPARSRSTWRAFLRARQFAECAAVPVPHPRSRRKVQSRLR
jgi:hypothetical protein